jgi:hypothetical protein
LAFYVTRNSSQRVRVLETLVLQNQLWLLMSDSMSVCYTTNTWFMHGKSQFTQDRLLVKQMNQLEVTSLFTLAHVAYISTTNVKLIQENVLTIIIYAISAHQPQLNK